MKERPIFRDFLVCWDDWRCIGWRTEKELNELMEQGNVTWYSKQGDKTPTYVNGEPSKMGLPPKPEL